MSFIVGQLLSNVKEPSTFYTNRVEVNNGRSYIQTFYTDNNILNVQVRDKRILYGTHTFQAQHHYYVKIKIKREEDSDLKLTLRLTKGTDTIEEYQYIDNFVVFQKTSLEDQSYPYSTYETVISPNSDYRNLDLVLTRERIDFVVSGTTSTSAILNQQSQTIGREITIVGFEIYEFKNLIQDIVNIPKDFFKIGIQGPMGMLMCINGEGIRIGPSGIYEIRNGYDVFFLGVAPRTSEDESGYYGRDNFIIDYQYGTIDSTT